MISETLKRSMEKRGKAGKDLHDDAHDNATGRHPRTERSRDSDACNGPLFHGNTLHSEGRCGGVAGESAAKPKAGVESDNMREIREFIEAEGGGERWGHREASEEAEEEEHVGEDGDGLDDGYVDPDRERTNALRRELMRGDQYKDVLKDFQAQLRVAEDGGVDVPVDFLDQLIGAS